jgi:DNA modification methylase
MRHFAIDAGGTENGTVDQWPGAGEVRLLTGDARTILTRMPKASVDCVVTSPPYWRQRDYGTAGQLGLEENIDDYIAALVAVFDQLHQVLKPTGTCWLNLGDSYLTSACGPRTTSGTPNGRPNVATSPRGFGAQRGLRAKNLAGIPWRVAIALQNRGWILRSEIIWHKPNAIPESAKDRPARRHEHLFLLTITEKYFFDPDPIRERYAGDRPMSRRAHRSANRPHTLTTTWPPASHPPGTDSQNDRPHHHQQQAGRHPGTLWSLPTRPSRHHHYAAFPIDLPLRCIAAGCPPAGVVLDPFSGSGTTVLAARQLGHAAIGIDLNHDFHQITQQRVAEQTLQPPNAHTPP